MDEELGIAYDIKRARILATQRQPRRLSAYVAKQLKSLATGDTVDLKVIGRRIPQMNELYIDKLGAVRRCKEQHSNRAQARVIVREAWLE